MKDISKLLSSEQLIHRYGSFFEKSSRLSLNESAVPERLRPLLPYACLWGLADDCERSELVKTAPPNAIEDLRFAVRMFEHELDDWLGGDAANDPEPTEEYVAFSAMRMIVDWL